MQNNPFKFIGPLDPEQDKQICVSRTDALDQVITGIRQGDYWTILGPRQIGKTTFLRQLKHQLGSHTCIYINLEAPTNNDQAFYKMIMTSIIEQAAPDTPAEIMSRWKDFGPELNFYFFLKYFQPEKDVSVVLMFDEIEKTSVVRSFLHIWRKIFNERYDHKEFDKYSVIIAGTVDIISLTVGPTSPFNIAKKQIMSELSEKECRKLISGTCKKMEIAMDENAQVRLYNETGGHPQLLQHLCYIMVETALAEKKKKLREKDIDKAIETLVVENDNLRTLKKEIETNKILENVVRRILNNEDVEYMAYQDLSITGTGPIARNGNYCKIRNNLYKKMIAALFRASATQNEEDRGAEYVVTIKSDKLFCDFKTEEDERRFLSILFDVDHIIIQLEKDGVNISLKLLDKREKLLLLYLAYKNYKAINAGFESWRKIPIDYKYRLSSNIENNKQHIPEWEVFVDNLEQEPYGEDIKAWIYSLRQKLKSSDSDDVIYSKSGRGSGYLLKGYVRFADQK